VLLCVRCRHGSAALLPLHRRPGFQTALDPPDISTHAAAKPQRDPLEEVVAVAADKPERDPLEEAVGLLPSLLHRQPEQWTCCAF